MDTKYKGNGIKKIIKYNDDKFNSGIILIISSILLLTVSFFALTEGDVYKYSYDEYGYDVNSDEYPYFILDYDIHQETIRYAKNLSRFYIYFKNFDADKAYNKIEELESFFIKNKDNFDASNYPEYNATETDNEGYEYSVSEETYNEDYQYTVSKGTEESSDKYFVDKEPERYYEEIDIINFDKDFHGLYKKYTDLKNVLQNYEEVKNYLDSVYYFRYTVIKEDNNGLIKEFTNTSSKDGVYTDKISIDSPMFKDVMFNGEYLSSAFKRNKLECTISIPSNIKHGRIYESIVNYEETNKISKLIKSYSYIILGISIMFSVYTIKNHKQAIVNYNQRVYKIFEKIPLLIKLCLALFTLGMIINETSLEYKRPLVTNMIYYNHIFGLILFVLIFCILFVYCIIFAQFLLKKIVHPKTLAHEPEIKFLLELFKNTNIITKSNNTLLLIIFIILFIISIVGSIVYLICVFEVMSYDPFFALLATILYLGALFLIIIGFKLIIAFSKLSFYVSEMANGSIDKIPTQQGMFSKSINNLNNINDGIKKSIEEMMKTERLKTELITNVSHDLKTPLTSVISYVELLKELPLNDKKAVEYIDIVSRKSDRLKVLIEDLFEAAKLSTGHTELDLKLVDIVELFNQTFGELSHKIENSNITFKTNIPKEQVYIEIDGKRMWRVFENLLNNVLKYSQENTRAYVSLEDNKDTVVITMKNTSSYELDFDPNELFERFKRGDKSRTTEGSGLGLSISKSIVELHKGSMNISIDGDLFKVEIILYK